MRAANHVSGRCRQSPTRRLAKWRRVKWSIHYRVHLAQFRHILTTLKFDSSLGGMGDDAGAGKLGTKTVRVARGLRAALHFFG
jgi:hypothetical protein